MNVEDLERQVKEIIAKVIEVPAEEIGPDADFIEDLEVDSLKAIEITGAIEKTFRIIVPEEAIRKIRTLNHAVALTRELLNAS